MSDLAHTEANPAAEPTEARFSVRSLFIATAVLAVIAALVGPLVRGLDPEKQFRLLVTWGCWLGALILWIAYQSRQRFEAEKHAGATLLRLPMFDEKTGSASPARKWFNVSGAVIFTLFALFVVSNAILDANARQEFSEVMFVFGFWGLLSLWWTIRVVTMFWWRNQIRFCEHGVLWDRSFIAWNHVVEYRWTDSKQRVLQLKGLNDRSVDSVLKIPVTADKRETVQSLLDQRTSPDALRLLPSILELGRVPILTAVKHPGFPRYVAGIVLRVLLLIGLIYFLATRPARIREFDEALIIGVVLSVATTVARAKWLSKQAGAPLLRIVGRRGWLGMLGAIALAAMFYAIGTNIQSTSTWPVYAAGIGFWWSLTSGAMYLFARQLDLRTNGVVLQGMSYWPWETVIVARWDPQHSGKLVLSRGWRRIVAKVPPEQRDAVDRIIAEKRIVE